MLASLACYGNKLQLTIVALESMLKRPLKQTQLLIRQTR